MGLTTTLKPFRGTAVALVAFLALAACKDEDNVKVAVPVFVPVDTFTINLQPPQSSYLNTSFELKVTNPQVAEELKAYMPEIRNGVIFLVSTREGSELASNEGKQKLGTDLVAMMNGLLNKNGFSNAVQGVNFTSFVMQ